MVAAQVDVEFALLDKELDEFAESAGRPHALRGNLRRAVQALEPHVVRLTQAFVRIERPRSAQLLSEELLVLSELALGKVVFTVKGVLQAEEVEDCRDEQKAIFNLQLTEDRHLVPVLVRSCNFREV